MNDILALVYGYARALWRRRWWAVIAAWAICVLAWIVVMCLPEKFQATARVYVDARTPVNRVLKDIALEQDINAQLAMVREALLSRPQLDAVARKVNLDAGVTNSGDMDALIGSLLEDLQVSITSVDPNPQWGQKANDALYTIAYQHRSRDTSLEVVRTLLDRFVNNVMNDNSRGASEAQGFLNSQIADLEKRLAEAEARLADFKGSNVGMLPGERGDYFTRLEGEMATLSQAKANLAIAMSRREELKRQLSSAGKYVPGTSGASTIGAVSDISARIQESEAKLELLLQRFTDKHPEVIAVRETIKELKERERKELDELERGGEGTRAIRSLSVNPVYQQIQMELNKVDVEIASLRGGVDEHEREVANLRKFVDTAPEVEQEFKHLNRDYNVLKTQYDTLVSRREQARVTDNASQSGIVRFDIIDPPAAGTSPIWPKRRLLMAIALVLGVGAGIAFALVPHLLRPTFDNTSALGRLTGLPVLGAVSSLRRASDVLQMRREVNRLAIAAGMLVVVGAVFVVFGNAGARAIQHFLT